MWAESKECGAESQPSHSPLREALDGSERWFVHRETGILFNVMDSRINLIN